MLYCDVNKYMILWVIEHDWNCYNIKAMCDHVVYLRLVYVGQVAVLVYLVIFTVWLVTDDDHF